MLLPIVWAPRYPHHILQDLALEFRNRLVALNMLIQVRDANVFYISKNYISKIVRQGRKEGKREVAEH